MMSEEAEVEPAALDDIDINDDDDQNSGMQEETPSQSTVEINDDDTSATSTDGTDITGLDDVTQLSDMPNLDKIAKLYEKYSIQCKELERLELQNADYRDSLLVKIQANEILAQQLTTEKEVRTEETQQLQRRCMEAEYQLKAFRDRAQAQETHAKKTYQEMCDKHTKEIETLRKSSTIAQTEKDAAVIKYATREAEVLKLKAANAKLLEDLKAVQTERDALQAGLRGTKNKEHAVKQNLEQKADELNDIQKEIERQKSIVAESEIKVKMANQRVTEVEAQNKKTETELISALKRLNQAKEETSTIKADYQRMFEEMQQSDSAKQSELQAQLREKMDQQEIYDVVIKELDDLKKQHRTTLLDVNEMKMKISESETTVSRLKEQLQTEKEENERITVEMNRLRPLAEQVESSQQSATEATERETQAREDCLQAQKEAESCRFEAEKMLTLTQQLTADNSQLHALNDNMSSKLSAQNMELERLNEQVHDLSKKLADIEHEHGCLQASTSGELRSLHEKVQQQIKTEQELLTKVDEERNQNKVLKKKHAASLKELKSELTSMKRRLAVADAGGGGNGVLPTGEKGLPSRASSSASNDRPCLHAVNSNTDSLHSNCDHNDRQPADTESIRSGSNEHDNRSTIDCRQRDRAESVVSSSAAGGNQQAMVEKICKLQRHLARRTEKIEFLEEHVKQLTEELQKKSRVIQSYILREETGALSPDAIDMNKWEELVEQAEISRHGATTMSALFYGRTDQRISSDMAMQINSKLQAVLEDALYKNITLKDNLETMGTEIAKLSRQNRELQLRSNGSS